MDNHYKFGESITSKHVHISIPLLLLMLMFPLAVLSSEIYVPADYSTIQEAINNANEGDEIIVSEGTYNERILFKGENIVLRSSDPTSPTVVGNTIIDGHGGGTVVRFTGSEDESCILAGFSIINGGADRGAGISGYSTLATIRYNIIQNCGAAHQGGAISDCDGLIEYNIVHDCTANRGGGLYLCDGVIQYNDVHDNFANNGGGLADCAGTIQHNDIHDNTANNGAGMKACNGLVQYNRLQTNISVGSGGALDAFVGGMVQNNIMYNNTAGGDGGAISWCQNTVIQNNRIYENLAIGNGGGLAYCFDDTIIQNNLIYNNYATTGGGLYWCYTIILNNTIFGNIAVDGGGLALCTLVIINNIIWDNLAFIEDQIFISNTPFYCCIQDWPEGLGIGNFSDDPMLVDPARADFHLQPESPCIDAGGNAGALVEDFEGHGRPLDTTDELRGDGTDYDIGADEFAFTLLWSQPPNMEDGFDTTCWKTVKTTGTLVVDDWSTTLPLPVNHIRWWGSYPGWLSDTPFAVPPPSQRPDSFRIRWSEYDDEATTSVPGEVIKEELVYVFTERWYGSVEDRMNPGQWEHEFAYECDLMSSWSDIVEPINYISIQAIFQEPPSFPWGWKNSVFHWNDDALITYDGGLTWTELTWPENHSLAGQSMDMAFELWGPAPTPSATPYPSPTPTPTPSPTLTPTPTPVLISRHFPNLVDGFDVESSRISETTTTLAADDWYYNSAFGINQIRWWGSYIGWRTDTPAEVLPPVVRPAGFNLKIYELHESEPFNLPGAVIHEEYCTEYTERWYAAVKDWDNPELWEHEFSYDCDLSTTWTLDVDADYFLSIQAVFDEIPEYHWGWLNSDERYNSGALISYDEGTSWTELSWPPEHRLEYQTMDLSFELWYSYGVQTPIATPTPTPTPTATATPLIRFGFDDDPEGWIFAGAIPPYQVPASMSGDGHIGMNAQGSANSFSYWYSPDILIDGASSLYKTTWTIGSSATNIDGAVQFRLRINQKGAWSAWNYIVNSNLGQAPYAGNDKIYNMYFDPVITATGDDLFILNYDILSFDPSDDTNSWIYLEEVEVSEAVLTPETLVVEFLFDTDPEGWTFFGDTIVFDVPLTSADSGRLGLNPNGSTSCFSYWLSPDVALEHGKIYRVLYEMSSSVTNPDEAVQMRLRVNQKGAWKAWDRIVNSNLNRAPSVSSPKFYSIVLDPNVQGVGDDGAVLNFDILSFDPSDNFNSWLYMNSVSVEEVAITP